MGKPLVHVKIGIAFEQFVSDAYDAILDQGNYSAAFELNSMLSDTESREIAVQTLLEFVDIYIDWAALVLVLLEFCFSCYSDSLDQVWLLYYALRLAGQKRNFFRF